MATYYNHSPGTDSPTWKTEFNDEGLVVWTHVSRSTGKILDVDESPDARDRRKAFCESAFKIMRRAYTRGRRR